MKMWRSTHPSHWNKQETMILSNTWGEDLGNKVLASEHSKLHGGGRQKGMVIGNLEGMSMSKSWRSVIGHIKIRTRDTPYRQQQSWSRGWKRNQPVGHVTFGMTCTWLDACCCVLPYLNLPSWEGRLCQQIASKSWEWDKTCNKGSLDESLKGTKAV